MARPGSGAVPPYGVAIQQAIARGDLKVMKELASEAEEHLQQWGDLRFALSLLKLEIARREQKE